LLNQRLAQHPSVLLAQRDSPESFFKKRLAIVNSPITWSRFSICPCHVTVHGNHAGVGVDCGLFGFGWAQAAVGTAAAVAVDGVAAFIDAIGADGFRMMGFPDVGA